MILRIKVMLLGVAISVLMLVLAFIVYESTSKAHQAHAATLTTGQRIVAIGRAHLGVPYVWQGSNLRYGVDCDAYVVRVLHLAGVYSVPWGPNPQYYGGVARQGPLQQGDVIAWSENYSGNVTHVGIYSGNGMVLHASAYFGQTVESPMKYVRGFMYPGRIYR